MVTDAQVRRLRQKLMDGKTQAAAAAAVLREHEEATELGALLSIDERGARVRILALRIPPASDR